MVRGRVDIDQEIKKIEQKIAKADKAREALLGKTNIADYIDRVPADVREQNETKLSNYTAEIEALGLAIKTFLSLKGSD
ncbi:valine--tRNA ligase [Linderina pennispora]|nr:valine--tRNA ligase [Linderina pennispora]